MCVRVRVSVSPSILDSGARRDGPIRKGEEAFDAPERRKGHKGVCGAIGSTRHELRARAQTLAKINRKGLQVKQMDEQVSSLVG